MKAEETVVFVTLDKGNCVCAAIVADEGWASLKEINELMYEAYCKHYQTKFVSTFNMEITIGEPLKDKNND